MVFCQFPINVISTKKKKKSLSLPSLPFVPRWFSSKLEMNSHILQKSLLLLALT